MKTKKAFQLSLRGKVLWVAADGLWTLATAEAYVKEFRALVKPIVAKPWAIVLDVRAWQVSPAEVFDLLVDNTTWCYQHNLTHVETICADNVLVMWQFAKATLAEKPAYLVSQIAADAQQAEQALLAAGFIDAD